MFNIDLISMATQYLSTSLLMYYLGVFPSAGNNPLQMMNQPNVLFDKVMVRIKKLDVLEVSLVLWSFLLPKTVALFPLAHALFWPSLILCGLWLLAVICCCLVIAVLAVSDYLSSSDVYLPGDDQCASMLLQLGYAVLDIVLLGCVCVVSMSAIGYAMSCLSGLGLAKLGQLSYLVVFVLGAAIHHFGIQSNTDVLGISAHVMPIPVNSEYIQEFPLKLYNLVKGNTLGNNGVDGPKDEGSRSRLV